MTIVDECFQAAQAGDAERLKALLKADPGLANAENSDGLTLLGYAAHFGHRDAVLALLDSGADVNAISHSKIAYIPSNTALHAALAGERNADVIRLLLERGARTDLLDSNGHTCLHTAAYHDDLVETIRMLIAFGADVRATSGSGETALSLAEKQGNRRVAALLREHGAGLV
ncbi:ankyrin repeat domain-containing protein [Cohnella thermotolerans]|uniref:ankyrin repeat domain-containing protein n=1 Tax=Cohnella thermotolerans TaxID=329858 RepID=UPI000552EF3F|nr:ankyrin repeat domain-containing protein [Cohnella thermotolerans]